MTTAKKSHHDDNLNITIEFLETGISLYEDFTVPARKLQGSTSYIGSCKMSSSYCIRQA